MEKKIKTTKTAASDVGVSIGYPDLKTDPALKTNKAAITGSLDFIRF